MVLTYCLVFVSFGPFVFKSSKLYVTGFIDNMYIPNVTKVIKIDSFIRYSKCFLKKKYDLII